MAEDNQGKGSQNNSYKRILKFAAVITLICVIGLIIGNLLLAYHKEWWYGGGVDVTSFAGRFWHHDFPVNLTMTKESTPVLKNPAWLSFFVAFSQFILAFLAALVALLGLKKVEKGLNKMTTYMKNMELSISKIQDYSFNVTQQKAEAETKEAEKIYKLLKDKNVNIQLVSGKRIIGTLNLEPDDSPQAIRVHTEKGDILVFKHSIASIDDFDLDQGGLQRV